MKKVLLSLLTFPVFCSYAQEAVTSYKKRPSLAIHLILNDFNTADLIRQRSLGSVLSNGDWSKIKDMDAGFGLEYIKGLTDHLDFSGRLDLSYLDYLFSNRPKLGTDNALFEGDANLRLKLMSDKYFFTPYVSWGIGASKYTGYWAAYMPFGAGFQFSLGHGEAFIFTNIQYRVPVTDNANYHFNYSLGFGAPIVARKEQAILSTP